MTNPTATKTLSTSDNPFVAQANESKSEVIQQISLACAHELPPGVREHIGHLESLFGTFIDLAAQTSARFASFTQNLDRLNPNWSSPHAVPVGTNPSASATGILILKLALKGFIENGVGAPLLHYIKGLTEGDSNGNALEQEHRLAIDELMSTEASGYAARLGRTFIDTISTGLKFQRIEALDADTVQTLAQNLWAKVADSANALLTLAHDGIHLHRAVQALPFNLEAQVDIGRRSNLRTKTISNLHAKIEWRDGALVVTDMNSTNGTFRFDGKWIKSQDESWQLRAGQVIAFSDPLESNTGIPCGVIVRIPTGKYLPPELSRDRLPSISRQIETLISELGVGSGIDIGTRSGCIIKIEGQNATYLDPVHLTIVRLDNLPDGCKCFEIRDGNGENHSLNGIQFGSTKMRSFSPFKPKLGAIIELPCPEGTEPIRFKVG